MSKIIKGTRFNGGLLKKTNNAFVLGDKLIIGKLWKPFTEQFESRASEPHQVSVLLLRRKAQIPL